MSRTRNALISVAEMYRADALAIERGTPGEVLMENAGRAIADAIRERWSQRPVSVLAGPGNNGGDGFATARHLIEAGWSVTVYLLGEVAALKGDAAIHAAKWQAASSEAPLTLGHFRGDANHIVIDCLFGAGLTRGISSEPRAALERAVRSGAIIVACDLPSGINGNDGRVLEYAAPADLTVTFARARIGHWLLPGRDYCGTLHVADIGISDAVIDDIGPRTFLSDPEIWMDVFPRAGADVNKFTRGHLQIVGGGRMTGAARLSARAARRIGAGLTTILAPNGAGDVYRAGDPGTLIEEVDDGAALTAILTDDRRNGLIVGPGNGLEPRTRDLALAALRSARSCVLDADALSIFKGDAKTLLDAIRGPVVMTPHEGEFARLFNLSGSKLERARAAAYTSGAVILLKGADTVIAEPDGRAMINTTGAPTLATAGSGDVLAGLIGGLMVQGMPAFEAAAAAAWLHGKIAELAGPGLIAEDLPEGLPGVLTLLFEGARGPRSSL